MKRFAPVVFLLLLACNRATPPAPIQKPSVLLITIDTLRADRVGRGLTPAIDGLAARGVRFTAARSTAPLTLPSHVVDHDRHVAAGTRRPRERRDARRRVLRWRAPSMTAGIRPARSSAPTSSIAGSVSRLGFDTYDDRVQRDPSGTARLEAERRGDIVVDAALQWLAGRGRDPFFAWVHLYDPHAPYNPPQAFLAQAGGDAYNGEVAFADAQVGRLLDWLRTSGQGERTIVARYRRSRRRARRSRRAHARDARLRLDAARAVDPGSSA